MSGGSGHPLLDIRDLTVRYGAAVTALDGVSLSVPAGGITAVLGGNGAGKTTLMRAISGTLARHRGAIVSGDVQLEGSSVLRLPAEKRTKSGIVQVPEGRRIFARLTVAENLRVGRAGNPRRRGGDVDRVYELFPVLAERRRQQGALLSGGEQQMLAIGRALMADPRVLLLDEPTLGLAPLIIVQIADLIRRLHAEGTTILLVEQNAGVALDLADTAYVFAAGSVALQGRAADLRKDDRVRRLYLGDESALETAEGGPS